MFLLEYRIFRAVRISFKFEIDIFSLEISIFSFDFDIFFLDIYVFLLKVSFGCRLQG